MKMRYSADPYRDVLDSRRCMMNNIALKTKHCRTKVSLTNVTEICKCRIQLKNDVT